MKRKGTDLREVMELLRQLPRGARIALGVLAVTVIVAAAGLPFAFGAVDDAQAELRRLRAATNQTANQARQAAQDYDYIVANTERYEDALGRGILAPQNRLEARHRLEDMQGYHYLVRMAFEMAAVRTQPGPGGHEILSTPITIEVGAMLDHDIFTLLRGLERAFPGYAVLRGFRLARQTEVTEDALARITAGQPVPFVSGSITLDWRTARAPNGEGRR